MINRGEFGEYFSKGLECENYIEKRKIRYKMKLSIDLKIENYYNY